ncbi:hypothetical protein NIES2109_57240 (plasmid) [Nostoc sp. HK-01]|nr:hypothetical protein NIES2109_57240 [Nostoc sp. HK-01]
MNNTEKLAQFANQQHFDDRAGKIFQAVCQDAGINNLPQTSVKQGNCLIEVLKHNEATPEFVKNLLSYSRRCCVNRQNGKFTYSRCFRAA